MLLHSFLASFFRRPRRLRILCCCSLALGSFGVTGTHADPQIKLLSGQNALAANAGWSGAPAIAAQATAVGAFTWGTSATADSAISTVLAQGSYTAQVSSVSGGTGVALVEIYDATSGGGAGTSAPHLINISTRGYVGTGGNELIAGFVVAGTTGQTVLIRASGPSLARFGVTGTLADPQVDLLAGQTVLASNAGWNGDPNIAAGAAAVGAFSWGSSASADSAILITLPPGAYTAEVKGLSGDTGVALVEIYALP
jgi:hypothetical protein